MSDGGKGSRPRPYSVDQKTFNSNWDATFGKKEKSSQKESTNQDKGLENVKGNFGKDSQESS